MPLKTHILPATTPSLWGLIQETFNKPPFLPRMLVLLVTGFFLLSSVYPNAFYNFNTNFSFTFKAPTSKVQAEHSTLGIPNKARNKSVNSRCKWAHYADWPYPSEFAGLLSPYRRKLLYVKTPKSSSSTTAHILQRFTSREGLIVGYPNFAGNEWTFQAERSLHDALMRQKVTEFDALVSHIIYRKLAVDEILGTGTSNSTRMKRPFRVTSVREPLRRSWSQYMHGVSRPNAAGFTLGAGNPLEFAQRLEIDGQLKYAAGYRYGVEPATLENVGSHYDHIVVSERVLESFVTLAPKLGLVASDLLFFSQKRHGFAQKITPNNTLDDIVRAKTTQDAEWHRLANAKLDNELQNLPGKITQILRDVPEMIIDVAKVCGKIDSEDNSCFTENETRTLIVWEGNQMCLARCIEGWAQQNIICK